jgi:hypothetical protein
MTIRSRMFALLLAVVVFLTLGVCAQAQGKKPKPSDPPPPTPPPATLTLNWQEGLNLVTCEPGSPGKLRVWKKGAEGAEFIETNGTQDEVNYRYLTLARLTAEEPPAIIVARFYSTKPTGGKNTYYIYLEVYKEGEAGVWQSTLESNGYLVEGNEFDGVASGDMNGDGIDEIVLRSQHQLALFVADDGRLTMKETLDLRDYYGRYAYANGVAVADLDGDGKSEIVVVSNTDSDRTWRGKILVIRDPLNSLKPKIYDVFSNWGTPPLSDHVRVVEPSENEAKAQIWSTVRGKGSSGETWLYGWEWSDDEGVNEAPICAEKLPGDWRVWRLDAGKLDDRTALFLAEANGDYLQVRLYPSEAGPTELIIDMAPAPTPARDVLIGPDGRIYLSGGRGEFYLGAFELKKETSGLYMFEQQWERNVTGEPAVNQTAVYCTDCEP